MSIFYHSLIFKTIEDDATKSGLRIQNIFSQTFSALRNNANFSFTSSFSTTLNDDINALNQYKAALQAGTPQAQAWANTMTMASQTAQSFAQSASFMTDTMDDFITAARIQDVALQASNKSLGNVKMLIGEYNGGLKNCGLSQKEFISAVGQSNAGLSKYLSGLNGAKGSMAGYITSLVGAKVASIALQAATMALNMAISMGLSMAISAIVQSISKWINKEKEAREAALETGSAAKQEAASIRELYNAYSEANSAYATNAGSKENLESATDSLLEALGLEQAELDKLIEKYGGLSEAINNATKDALKNNLTELTAGYQAASETLLDTTKDGWFESFSMLNFNHGDGGQVFADVLKDAGLIDAGSYGSVGGSIYLGENETVEGLIEMFGNLSAMRDALDAQVGILYSREELAESNLYKEINEKINSFSTEYGELESYINQINKTVAQLDYMSFTETNGIPKTQAEFEALKQSMLETAASSGQFVGSQEQIESAITNTLAAIPELSGFINTYTNTIQDAQTIADNLSISFDDLFQGDTDFIKSVDSYIDKVNSLQDALTKYRSGNFSNDDLVKLIKDFPKLENETENLDVAIVNLLGDLNSDMLNGFSEQFGNMETDEDVAALQSFQNAVLELGEVVGNTEFSIDIATETDGMADLFTAMKESVTSIGLTTESINNLKSRFQDLENYDAAKLFEKTANGVHLNTKALRELESAYEQQKKASIDSELQSLTAQYNNLTKEINSTSDAAKRAELYKKREEILTQIEDTSLLAAQYAGLTSAFYKWEQAQSIGEEGDMYDSLAGGLENIKELYDDGLVGTNKFRTAVQLMSNEDLSTASIDELMAAYDSGYSKMTRYFKDSSDGCLNFLNDVQALNSDWVSMNEDGSWDINFGVGNDQEIADALGINVESVQAILRKLSDYGFDINLDSMYSSLDMLKSEAEEANDKLKELGITDYTFSFNTDSIENLNTQIEVAKETLEQFKNEDGTVNLELAGAEEAQGILATLIYQKQSLDKAAILSVDTSNASTDIENVIAKLQEFKSSYNNLEVQTEIGADTTQAKADVDAALTELSSEHAEILAKLGIDTTSADAAIASINALTPEVMVTCGLDATLIENYQAAEHTTEGTVIWDNNIAKVTAWANKNHTANGTVNWSNNTRNVRTYFTATGTVNWKNDAGAAGTAHAQGTAKARGDWGTKESGTALGGELGQELVVRDGKFFTIGDKGAEFFQYKKGDIIFNADQTEEIFKKGKITSSAPRGRLFAQGTAFSNGSGKITAKGSVKTTYSGNSSSKKNGSDSNSNSDSDSDEPEVIDLIAIAIERLERTIKNLEVTATSTYKTLKERLSATSKEISKVTSEISLQEKAYNRYMQEANSVGLSSDLKKKVQNGTIDINEYSGETAELIKEYQEWYEKALDCADAIEELHENLASLYEDNFNNTATDFENQLSMLEHMTNTYENSIADLEARGYLGSAKYYEALKDVEKQNVATLKKELDALIIAMSEAVNSGEIKEGSEVWYEMQREINETKEAIQEANTEIIELDNSIRELDWKTFDYIQERISAITNETQFLIDLIASSDLYDDKGQLTDTGMATMGLHGQNYNTYMAQSDQYASEIEEINQELANDPYNTDLIARKEELLELQRESILAAEAEKQAIVDMVEEGINIELAALKELIDAYTDSLDSAKDLYDYQKKIKKQTDEIATLQKQLSAYKNDMSEENRARVQKIEVDLADAIEELEETEYEHYISEQKKMLDNLYDEYELILNERLDNIDTLIGDMIDATNANASTIKTTLETESANVGYTMTEGLKAVWSNEGGANAIIAKYGDGFLSQLTSVNNVLNAIAKKIGAMTEESDKQAETNIKNETTKQETKSSSTTTTKPSSSTSTTTTKTIKVGGKINAGSAKIYSSIDDKKGATQYYDEDPIYTVLEEKSGYLKVRHHSLSSGITGWFKKSDVKAYKTGGLVDYTGLAQLDGTPRKPELVLDAKDTENFIALKDALRSMVEKNISLNGYGDISHISNSNGISNILPEIKGIASIAEYLPRITTAPDGTQSVQVGDVTYEISIPIEHIDDYNDFVNKLRQDDKFEKMIQSMTLERMLGGSQFSKNKYKW